MKKKIAIFCVLLFCAMIFTGCGKQTEDVFVSAETESENASDTASDTNPSGTNEAQLSDEESSEAVNAELASEESAEAVTAESVSEESVCYVYVCGAVVNPGVYQLKSGSRIYEAIEMAGGVLEEGFAEGINQAALVSDGTKIRIPTLEEWETGEFQEDSTEMGNIEVSETNSGLVNINTATVSELCTLSGIGKTRAEAIVAYRNEHGAFQSIEQIKEVSGIKEGLYSKIKDDITI